MSFVLVGLGGAVGTLLRYGLSLALARQTLESGFPVGTFAANVLGSFLLGVVMTVFDGAQIGGTDARLVLGVGVLGGFTTYSSFNLETIRLAQEGHAGRAVVYAAVTLAGCLLAGLAGILIARWARGGAT